MSATAFHLLPSEIRRQLWIMVFEEDLENIQEPILIALRPHPDLYFEALPIFYSLKTVTMTICPSLKFWPLFPTSTATLHLVQNLRIIHADRHACCPRTVGFLSTPKLFPDLTAVKELEYFHIGTDTLLQRYVRVFLDEFSLRKLTLETKSSRDRPVNMPRTGLALDGEVTEVKRYEPYTKRFVWVARSPQGVLSLKESERQ